MRNVLTSLLDFTVLPEVSINSQRLLVSGLCLFMASTAWGKSLQWSTTIEEAGDTTPITQQEDLEGSIYVLSTSFGS